MRVVEGRVCRVRPKRVEILNTLLEMVSYTQSGRPNPREGIVLNPKKLYRLYREERLMVRKRGGRKRALGTRTPMAIPQGANQRWSLDFVSDALASSRRFRILAVVDPMN